MASPIASATAMKKISDDSKITKAARAKTAKKTDTAGSDALPSEGFAIAVDEASASLQDSAEIDTNGQSASQSAELMPPSDDMPSKRDDPGRVDFLLSNGEAGFVMNSSASSVPRVNTRPSASEARGSAMAKPSEGIAPSNSIRRHAINRAPNFQPSYPPVTQSSDRIAIFIDGSNLFYAASHLNIEVDYRRLLTTLVRGRRLLRAYFYTGVDPQNEKQRGFLLWLNRHGHRVVSKELVQLPDGSRKANMHVEMAVDMMRISEYCSTLTLLGGDGNLAYALEVLSQRGVSIEVVSLQSMTSDSLIDLADSYTDLADLRDEIKR